MQEFLLFPGHFAGFPASPFMVIPNEVKDPVDDQEQGHLFSVQPEPARLPLSCFSGDNYVSEEIRMKGETGPAGHIPAAFPHWEGNDVGGFVPSEIALIQPLNLDIIDEGDTDFGIRQGQVGQYRPDRPSYFS